MEIFSNLISTSILVRISFESELTGGMLRLLPFSLLMNTYAYLRWEKATTLYPSVSATSISSKAAFIMRTTWRWAAGRRSEPTIDSALQSASSSTHSEYSHALPPKLSLDAFLYGLVGERSTRRARPLGHDRWGDYGSEGERGRGQEYVGNGGLCVSSGADEWGGPIIYL